MLSITDRRLSDGFQVSVGAEHYGVTENFW
jgi:hypothetical protein